MINAQEARFSSRDVPPDVKVRLSITGLAYSILKPEISTIDVLSHVELHEFRLIVKKKDRETGKVLSECTYPIDPGDPVSLEVAGSIPPGNVDAGKDDLNVNVDGEFPLAEMINMTSLHGSKLELSVPEGVSKPNTVSIRHAAFYAQRINPVPFRFEGSDNTKTDPKTIGYIMGGKILSTDPAGEVVLRSKNLPDGVLTLPGSSNASQDAQEFVYDIAFDNHCTNEELFLSNLGTRTDFFYYYEVLKDVQKPGQTFELVAQPQILTTPPPGGTTLTAACVPAVGEPPGS